MLYSDNNKYKIIENLKKIKNFITYIIQFSQIIFNNNNNKTNYAQINISVTVSLKSLTSETQWDKNLARKKEYNQYLHLMKH